MTRIRSIQLALVLGTLVLTLGASVVEADPPANAPWSFEAIAGITGGDVGKHVSIAFIPGTGKPYISYYDETIGDLRLIYPHATSGNCGPNNEWYCEAPDTEGDVGQYSSIDYYRNDVTGENKIGIAYYDATNDALKVAIWSSTGIPVPGWTVSTIDDGGVGNFSIGRFASLKFDSTGAVHIVYTYSYTDGMGGPPSNTIGHAHSVASGGDCGEGAAAGRWQCDNISGGDPSYGFFSSLALTTADVPVVASTEGDLSLCDKGSGAWSCRTIDNFGGGTISLAIDQLDFPHIASYDRDNGKLMYAKYVGSGGNCGLDGGTYEYQCDVIDTIGEGLNQVGISIAVDLEGYPIIAYQEASDPMGVSVLNIARPAFAHGTSIGNCGPIVNLNHSWQCTTIDDATQGGGAGNLYEADFTSVAVDPNGFAAIAYNEYDDYNNEGRLKFAYQESMGLIFSDDFESGSVSGWSSSASGR